MPLIARDIGIDLGTANTLVYLKGRGVILMEPSVVAVNSHTEKVLAVGNEAKEMIGRTPGSIIAIRPLKDGVIADFEMTRAMLKYFIKKAMPTKSFIKPRVVVCTPAGVTEVEKRAVEEAVISAGGREAYLIEEPMAAAIGANLPVEEPVGSMIIDIGGGTSEVAVISLGGIVLSQSFRVAGDTLEAAIVQYVRREFNLLIGDRTAERLKIEIGSALPYPEEEVMSINGRDLLSGLPKTIEIHPTHIREAMRDQINSIIDVIKVTLEKTPPELAADIMQHGIVLTGGGAYLRELDTLVSRETGISARVADNPYNCVVLGTGKVLDEINMLSNLLISK